MVGKDGRRTAALAREIRAYLKAHPNAADSVDGIAKWWLARQRYVEALDEIQEALEELVVQGVVAKHVTAGGKTIYASTEQDRNR